LTEQTKTGNSVLLFVVSSVISEFHFTLAYYLQNLIADNLKNTFPAERLSN